MTRRYAWVGIALGLMLALFASVTTLPACYDLPKPVCGFQCGAAGECPDDYTCSNDNRCHLDGSQPTVCGAIPDGGVDADIDDAPFDGPPDAPPDAPTPIDAPLDAPALDAAFDAPVIPLDAPTLDASTLDAAIDAL